MTYLYKKCLSWASNSHSLLGVALGVSLSFLGGATTPALAGALPPADLHLASNARIGDKSSVLQAKQDNTDLQEKLIREAISSRNVDLETLSAAVAMAPEKAEVRQELEDYFIEVGRLEKDANYTPTDLRYVTNTLIAEQLFRDRISEVESDTGFVGRVGDWVDRYMLRQIPIGMVEDLTKRRERKGEELLQAALTMNPKQYKEFISNYIDELSDEGFFLSDNIYALQDGFDEALNAGYDPWAGLKQFLAVSGLLLLGNTLWLAQKAWATPSKSKISRFVSGSLMCAVPPFFSALTKTEMDIVAAVVTIPFIALYLLIGGIFAHQLAKALRNIVEKFNALPD